MLDPPHGGAAAQIAQYQKNPKEWKPAPTTEIPEGMPIGMGISALSDWVCDVDGDPLRP